MVGASAMVAINNTRQADGWGMLVVLGVAAACVLFLVGLLVRDWLGERRKKRRQQAEAYVRVIGESLGDLPMKITRKP